MGDIGLSNRFEKNRGSVEAFYSSYVESLKNDEKLKELFPEIIERLQEDLSVEEIQELIIPIEEYLKIEKYKKELFYNLSHDYNTLVSDKVEENYKIGKIEEIPLCKKITLEVYEELKKAYSDEVLYFENLYWEEIKEYMEKYLYEGRKYTFQNITEFAQFIDRIGFYEGVMISDKAFNLVNRALERYGVELYGNIVGTAKSFSCEYSDFLKFKNMIPDEIAMLEDVNSSEDEQCQAVFSIKRKCGNYLTIKEGQYMI